MSVEKIIADWKKKKYHPVYWVEGEEEFYIDQLLDFAERQLLSESEVSFNLSIFYGKDANWADVINTCRKYPMFSTMQVVLLKEAQQMRDLEKLIPYLQAPLASTLFVVAYKTKKLDARTKLAKLVKEKAVYALSKKLYDNELPGWVNNFVSALGYSISSKANLLIVDHVGNDLNRIKNEIDKIIINLGSRKNISELDVENFVGISREFNGFEFQNAIANKDLTKAMRIISHFEANPSTDSIHRLLPTLYAFFSKVYMLYGSDFNKATAASQLGVAPRMAQSYIHASEIFKLREVESILLLLHSYNLKSLGVNAVSGITDPELMKELVGKIFAQ